MSKQITILALATLLLAACGSAPQRTAETHGAVPVEEHAAERAQQPSSAGGYLTGDGPGENAPADIDAIPDAVPKFEPLHRYANGAYIALGKNYTPQTVAGNFKERGIASWYGKKFHGHRTSSGETYDMYAMTAAHPTLPIPSYVRVTNLANQKSVIVRINDRGPFLHDRVIDLSYTAAHKLGIIGDGSAEVEVESITADTATNITVKAEAVESKPLEKTEPVITTALPIASEVPSTASAAPAADSNVYLQLGAFKSQDAAESFMTKMRDTLGDAGKQISLFVKDGLARVHIGPYANEGEARSSAESLTGKLGFKPLLNLH